MQRLRLLLLTGFGLGHVRPAPGTWGSLPPVIVALMLVWITSTDGLSTAEIVAVNLALAMTALLFAMACISCGVEAEQHYARKDPPNVVADEIAGQSIALLLLPWRGFHSHDGIAWNLMIAFAAFLSFRAMDILKAPPARALQRLRAGWGIVIDDLIAGTYAWVIAQLIVRGALPLLMD